MLKQVNEIIAFYAAKVSYLSYFFIVGIYLVVSLYTVTPYKSSLALYLYFFSVSVVIAMSEDN